MRIRTLFAYFVFLGIAAQPASGEQSKEPSFDAILRSVEAAFEAGDSPAVKAQALHTGEIISTYVQRISELSGVKSLVIPVNFPSLRLQDARFRNLDDDGNGALILGKSGKLRINLW